MGTKLLLIKYYLDLPHKLNPESKKLVKILQHVLQLKILPMGHVPLVKAHKMQGLVPVEASLGKKMASTYS